MSVTETAQAEATQDPLRMLGDESIPVRDRLRAFLKAGSPLALVSRAIRRSQSSIAAYLQGSFDGNEQRLEAAIGRMLATQALQPSRVFVPEFKLTNVAEDILGALLQAQLDGDIALVVGPSGIGKSTAIRHYAQAEPNCYLVTVSAAWTTQTLVQQIARRVGLDRAGKDLAALSMEIADCLRNSGALIVIDEAQHLTARSLEVLRSVYDEAQIGLAMVAQLNLYAVLERGDGKTTFDQFRNRIGVHLKLSASSREDLALILPADTQRSVVAYLHQSSGGCMRIAVKLFSRAQRVAAASGNGEKVTLDLVKQINGD